jgi:hypothetical protein
MMEDFRKAAVSAYKERKIEAGIYAIRCAGTDSVWVGSAPDLTTIKNRIWFTLRHGSNLHRSLQDSWDTYGSDAFSFEVVARLPDNDEVTGYLRSGMLKTLLADWAKNLSAIRI